jgi:hypothetical protein
MHDGQEASLPRNGLSAIELISAARATTFGIQKVSVLLRFVSKIGIDFNVISTGFSTAKGRRFRRKSGQN